MTREWLDAQLGRMIVLKAMPGDSDPYWESLSDIPEHVLEDGIGHGLKTRAWFPTPAEIRMDCDVAARQNRPVYVPPTSRIVPIDGERTVHIANPFGGAGITVQVTHDVEPFCSTCDDSGWAKWWCGTSTRVRMPWLTARRCVRRNAHGDHDWAESCTCVEHNPVIARRKAAQVTYATSPEKVA